MNQPIAIIPARGGSKRVPGKNIRPLGGRPVIAHAIRTAQATGLFRRILVSTEDPDIAGIARHWGAETPFLRSPELADDHAVLEEVIMDALARLREAGDTPEFACCLFATAVLLQPEHLIEGWERLQASGAATSMAVLPYPSPVHRALGINESDRLEMFWPEFERTRSQDLPRAYYDAGQFYWIDVAQAERAGGFYWRDAVPVVLPPSSAMDIDTEEDFREAENLFRRRGSE